MPHEKLTPSFTFTEDRLKELEQVVPEAFADGRVQWDVLREALGAWMDDADAEEGDGGAVEHFGLNWPGKRQARRLAAKPSHGTLVPAPGEGVNEDTTGNLFIEGDNLEVLKLLQKSYAGRVKMIYIDPPYNTGNDFIYKDDFSEPLESYLERSGQKGERGELLTTNPKAGGRFHSNWLNMIYPRLRLARTLLRDDGTIFVSIDDNEVHNLRAVMDEVFGPENLVAQFVWQHSVQGKNDTKTVSNHHNYVVVYGRSSEVEIAKFGRTEEHNVNYSNPDNDPKGAWRSGDFRSPHYRENLRYALTTPSGKLIEPPPNGWRWDKVTIQRKIETKEIEFRNNETKILRKIYLANQEGRIAESILFAKDAGTTREASNELKQLFGGNAPFDTPKPTKLITQLAAIAGTGKTDIILDFFAGSATTAHAVLQLNHEDGGNRQFIIVQLPEETGNVQFPTISDIGKKRIRRVITKMNEEPVLEMRDTPEDLGFNVFKLAPSHFKQWRNAEGKDIETIRTLFDDFETPLAEDWTPDGLLTEVLLLEGFPLDSQVEQLIDLAENTVQRVTSPACGHALFVCFDDTLTPAMVDTLPLGEQDVFVCLDSALDDATKLRLSQTGTLRTI